MSSYFFHFDYFFKSGCPKPTQLPNSLMDCVGSFILLQLGISITF